MNRRSRILALKHFDMCSGTLLPDVMHDLLEGAVQHILQLLVSYCIDEKNYFNLSLLNAKIEGIELGYMENTRPAPVDNSWHLRQNGTQLFSFNECVIVLYDTCSFTDMDTCKVTSSDDWLLCS